MLQLGYRSEYVPRGATAVLMELLRSDKRNSLGFWFYISMRKRTDTKKTRAGERLIGHFCNSLWSITTRRSHPETPCRLSLKPPSLFYINHPRSTLGITSFVFVFWLLLRFSRDWSSASGSSRRRNLYDAKRYGVFHFAHYYRFFLFFFNGSLFVSFPGWWLLSGGCARPRRGIQPT